MRTRRDDPLDDFYRRVVSVDDVSKTVYVAGTGPGVILMPEMPGISPDVARLARWIRDAGFCVYLPSLFGVDGAYPTTEAGEAVVRRACVSAEFRAFAGGGTSPVVAWLRGLARIAHTECGGPGVGAVGLCFTGNFALTMHSNQPSSPRSSTIPRYRSTTPEDWRSQTRTQLPSPNASNETD